MSKYTPKLVKAAEPHLHPGEVVEIGAFATVGSVSVKRRVLTAAIVGIATAGTVVATARPARRFIAVTSERLMFFNGEGTFGRPGKLLFSVPRDAVEVTKAGRHLLYFRMELAVAGQEKGLRLNFTGRQTMEKIVAMLPVADSAGALRQEARQAQ